MVKVNNWFLLAFVFTIAIILCAGCSRKSVWVYLGTGFENKTVTMSVHTTGSDTVYCDQITVDSLLVNNYVLDLTYYTELNLKKRYRNAIEIVASGEKINYLVKKYNRGYYFDFLKDDSITVKPIPKGYKFY
jgi:hypothetical protein